MLHFSHHQGQPTLPILSASGGGGEAAAPTRLTPSLSSRDSLYSIVFLILGYVYFLGSNNSTIFVEKIYIPKMGDFKKNLIYLK